MPEPHGGLFDTITQLLGKVREQGLTPPAEAAATRDAYLRSLGLQQDKDGTLKPATPLVPTITLTVTKYGYWRRACESGQHVAHPDWTCDEVDQQRAHAQAVMGRIGRAFDADLARTAMDDVPAALRGARWEVGR